MRPTIALWIVAALVAGLTAGYLLRGSSPRVMEAADAGGEARIDALLSRIERLEATQGRASSSASRASGAAGGIGATGEPLPPTPEQRDAQRRANDQHFQDALAKAFASQTAGPVRDARTAGIDAALVDPGVLEAEAQPVSEDVECRAAMCRVRARFAAGADSSDWVGRLLLAMGNVLPYASVTSSQAPDGSTETIVYASRENERPPVAWTQPDTAR